MHIKDSASATLAVLFFLTSCQPASLNHTTSDKALNTNLTSNQTPVFLDPLDFQSNSFHDYVKNFPTMDEAKGAFAGAFGTKADGEICPFENTTSVGQLPQGCNVTIVVTENGSPILTLVNPAPGRYPVRHGCNCGDSHIRAVATLSGTCSGERILSDYVLQGQPCGPTPTPTPVKRNCGSSSLLPGELGEGASACQAPPLDQENLRTFDSFQPRLSAISAQMARLGASPNAQSFSVQAGGNIDARLQRLQEDYNRVLQTREPYLQTLKNHVNAISQQIEAIHSAFPPDLDIDLVLPEASDFASLEELQEEADHLTQSLEALTTDDTSYSLGIAISSYAKLLKLEQILLNDYISAAPKLITAETKSVPNYLSTLQTKLNLYSIKISEQQARLNQLVLDSSSGLGIPPQDFSIDNYTALEAQVYQSLTKIQQDFLEIDQLINSQEFRIQAKNDNFLQQSWEALQDKYNAFSEAVLNSGKYTADQVEAARKAFVDQAKQTRDAVATYAPQALQRYDAFVSPLDDAFGFLPGWKFSSDMRMLMIQCTGAQDPLALRYFSHLPLRLPDPPTPSNPPPQGVKIFDSPYDVTGLVPGVVYIYVVNENNRFVVARRGDPVTGTKHSQLTGGRSAKAGGELKLALNGLSVQVNDQTGRFRRTSAQAVDQVAKYLSHAVPKVTKVSGAL